MTGRDGGTRADGSRPAADAGTPPADADRGAIRVLIADDQAASRRGLRVLLGDYDDIEVVGEAESGRLALVEVERLHPEIVLMDVRMPDGDGLWATEEIVRSGQETSVIVMTTFSLDEYMFGALDAGCAAFVRKGGRPDEFAEAIRAVANGEGLVARAVTRRLIAEFAKRSSQRMSDPSGLIALTEREAEIVREIAAGHSTDEVARLLFLSVGTVQGHVTRVLTKLGLRDRAQLVIWAFHNGLAS